MYTSWLVYTMDMLKNIPFSVEEEVIAKAHDTTPNEMATECVADIAERKRRRERLERFFKAFEGVDLGPKMTREEMNARR